MNEHDKIMFPVHHKVKHHATLPGIDINDGDIDCDSRNVEEIIIQSYQVAQKMAASVEMKIHSMKKNLFNMEESSKMAKKLLEFNSLTESEILTIDDSSDKYNEENDDDKEDVDQYDTHIEGDDEGDIFEDDNNQEDHYCEDYVIAGAEDVDNEYDADNTENVADEDENEKSIIDFYAYDSLEDDTEQTLIFENLQAASFAGTYWRDYSLKRS